MPHNLMKPSEESPHVAPLCLSARFACNCRAKEVLTVQTVIDINLPDELLDWTIRRLIEDIRREVRQHLVAS